MKKETLFDYQKIVVELDSGADRKTRCSQAFEDCYRSRISAMRHENELLRMKLFKRNNTVVSL